VAARFAKPYVDAFFAVAGSIEAVEPHLPALESFAAALRASGELKKLLLNPGLARATRKAILDAVAARVGLTGLGERLLSLLHQNRRLGRLPDVLAALRERLDVERKIVEARIISARPLDPAVIESVRRMVEVRTRKVARVVAAVDPGLLGGFVVSVGSARLDASLARRLEKARAAFHALSPA
jgi:F-type H+-transporting ATPase subunit delta